VNEKKKIKDKIILEKYSLSEDEKKSIYTMFFGPYIEEWRNEKGIVENSDETIAKRLSLTVSIVSWYTNTICQAHFKKIEKLHRVNK
jgi:uncharacterized membrane protein YbaN (DUF454 family)